MANVKVYKRGATKLSGTIVIEIEGGYPPQQLVLTFDQAGQVARELEDLLGGGNSGPLNPVPWPAAKTAESTAWVERTSHMKHQDLIAFSRNEVPRRTRLVLAAMAFVLTWMAFLFLYADTILNRFGLPTFLIAAAFGVVVLVAVAIRNLAALPKCPHCGITLVAGLLHAAVASGKCGRCGQSIED